MIEKFAPNADRVAWSPSGDEIVLLDLETSSYLSLNDSAAELWQRMADGATHADLVSDLTSRYDVDEQTARSDVDDLLGELTQRGYVRVSRT